MHVKSNSTLGYLALSIGGLASAFSFIFIAHLNTINNEMLSMAMTFGCATLLFTVFNWKNLPRLYRLIINNFKPLLYLNIATLFSWFGTFIALKYIDPATKICIGFGLIAVTNFFIATSVRKIKKNKHLLFSIAFILFSMGLIINQHIHTNHTSSLAMIAVGLMWAIAGGVGGGFIGINSERIGKAGFTITHILATRFYLLVIVSAMIFLFTPHHSPITIHWSYI